MNTKELNSKVKKLAKLQAQSAALGAQIDELKGELKAELTARCTDTLQVDSYKLCWKPVTSARFSAQTFQRDHAALYAQYKEACTTWCFTMTAVCAPDIRTVAAHKVSAA